ncbi:hypothetical protein [Flavobacterium sp. NRK1]|uniref:hypothetical protein n=1 Tax=Flavobacterium sp. NRK1 TaxID=2954929 RepID=UPI002092EB01|nr:hypothetical protein [Flavobacterium sp. NRK1]MCO6149051.1 hypothetical protein [Flavobacterium sp. NRK1]
MRGWAVYMKLVAVVPVMQMAVLLYLAFFTVGDGAMQWLGAEFGAGTVVYLVYAALFFSPYVRLKYCLLIRCIVAGLIANHVLYEIRPLISYDLYGNLYTKLCCLCSLLCWLMLVYGNKNKKSCGANL